MAEANKNISDRTEWKLPEGYKGKYEEAKAKARAASKKRVNALDGGMADGECTEGDDWSDSDSDIMGSTSGGHRVCALRMSKTDSEVPPPPAPHREPRPSQSTLVYNGDDSNVTTDGLDEETYGQVNQWAHKTTVSLKSSKKETTKAYHVDSIQQLDKMLNNKSKVARIAAVPGKKKMKAIAKGKIPDTLLAEDEQWALVDSGATINAACIKKQFAMYANHVIASRAQLAGETATTANGQEMKNEGRCRVDATVDGFNFPICFQNMAVDVPIISVRKIVKHGKRVTFEEDGGTIYNRATGTTLRFEEFDGAYWIKLKVKAPSDQPPCDQGTGLSKSDFIRPGSA